MDSNSLNRFLKAQETMYETALEEIKKQESSKDFSGGRNI